MPSRSSKRTRAEAIWVLDLFAGTVSATDQRSDTRCDSFYSHVSGAAARLALAAEFAVPVDGILLEDRASEAAEAAGLLRDGWRPGDEVIRLTPERCETCGQELRPYLP